MTRVGARNVCFFVSNANFIATGVAVYQNIVEYSEYLFPVKKARSPVEFRTASQIH
jgi:hypothetical protein